MHFSSYFLFAFIFNLLQKSFTFNCTSSAFYLFNLFHSQLTNLSSYINEKDGSSNVIDLSCIKNLNGIGLSDQTISDVESLDNNRILVYLNKSINQNQQKIIVKVLNINRISHLNLAEMKLPRISRRMFFHLKKLENFRIENTYFTSVDTGVFDSVDHLNSLSISYGSFEAISILKLNETKCDFLINLELYSDDIKHLDQQSFRRLSNLKLLFLNGNKIELIQPNTFKYLVRLTFLDLSNNKIAKIGDYAFSNLIKLESLFMKQNKLESLDESAINDLVNMKNLDLSENQLKSISTVPINRFKLLKSLDLSMNPFDDLDLVFKTNKSASIDCFNRKNGFELSLMTLKTEKKIDSISFGCFNNLESLKLYRNQLSWIEETKTIAIRLNDLMNLKYFTLENFNMRTIKTFDLISNSKVSIKSIGFLNNLIESIDFVEFKGLSGLKKLSLAINKIVSIENVTFKGIESLESLSLSGNRLTSLKFVRFSGIYNLKVLDLSSNPIDTLEDSRFEGVEKLEMLLLNQSRIKSLEQAYFVGIRNLLHLNVGSNPIDKKSRRFAFKGIERLESLDLSQIGLESAENLQFDGIEQLKSLDLSQNNFIRVNQVILLRNLIRLEILTLKRCFLLLGSANLTFTNLSKTLKKLYLSLNGFVSLDRIELNGVDSLNHIDLTENSMRKLENPLQICCPTNRTNNETKEQLAIDLDGNGIYQIRPKKFSQNVRISISNTVLFSYTNLPFRILFDISRQHNLLFTYYPTYIDLDLVNQNLHIFLKRKFRLFRFYQSIQIRLENHDSIEITCSIVFAMFRKCLIARYLIGTQFQYDSFLDNCRMETLNPNQKL